jgi:hypothetical protein
MNSVSGIFVALAVIFGGGFALDKIYVAAKTAAVERVHRGMPSLSEFTHRLSCSEISASGTLVVKKCGKRQEFNERHP